MMHRSAVECIFYFVNNKHVENVGVSFTDSEDGVYM